MFTELIDAPTIEPVTVDEQAEFSHVDVPVASPPDAAYLQLSALIAAARSIVETKTGRALITQGWRLKRDSFPGLTWTNNYYNNLQPRFPLSAPIQLLHQPVVADSVVVKYLDTTGAEQTWDESNYTVEDGKVYPKLNVTWPITACVPNAVSIEYTSGYGDDAADVPERLKTAIKFLVTHWVDTRVPVSEAPGKTEVPMTVSALIGSYRVMYFPESTQG